MSVQDLLRKMREEEDGVIFSREKKQTKVETKEVQVKDTTNNEFICFRIKLPKTELPQPPPLIQEQKEEPIVQQEKLSPEELFKNSGTLEKYRGEWFEQYNAAQRSTKRNSISMKMKEGKFLITPKGEKVILPDLDLNNKMTNDILSEKWLED